MEGSSRRRRLWGINTKEARATLAFSPPKKIEGNTIKRVGADYRESIKMSYG